MDEGNAPAVGALPGDLVDQANAGGFQASEGRGEVVDGIGDVVHTAAAFGQVAANGSVRVGGTDELHVAQSRPVDDGVDALLRHGKPLAVAEADTLVVGHRIVEVVDDDANMVEPEVSNSLLDVVTHRQ